MPAPDSILQNMSSLPPEARKLRKLGWLNLMLQSDPSIEGDTCSFVAARPATERLNHVFVLMRFVGGWLGFACASKHYTQYHLTCCPVRRCAQHRLVYRHLNFSLNASHTADAASSAVRECRIALRDANPTAQWGGWFQLDHTGHAAVARWAMAGANVSNLVGHVRTARPVCVAGLRLHVWSYAAPSSHICLFPQYGW